eukprot:14676731-Heterocapsa_arctica.AAC.2
MGPLDVVDVALDYPDAAGTVDTARYNSGKLLAALLYPELIVLDAPKEGCQSLASLARRASGSHN